jgi:hypothetical protein
MGENLLFLQSCESRECRKKHKKQITTQCEVVSTIHELNKKTKTVRCIECGKTYKLTKT